VNQIAELGKQNDDIKRVLAEVMKEKNVAGVLTIPKKSKAIHYMEKEDGTMKKMEEDFVTFVARGQRPQESFNIGRRKETRKERKSRNNQINPLFSLFPIFLGNCLNPYAIILHSKSILKASGRV